MQENEYPEKLYEFLTKIRSILGRIWQDFSDFQRQILADCIKKGTILRRISLLQARKWGKGHEKCATPCKFPKDLISCFVAFYIFIVHMLRGKQIRCTIENGACTQ